VATLKRTLFKYIHQDVRVKVVSAIRHVRQDGYFGWISSMIALGVCVSIRFYVQRYGDFLGSGALMPAVMIAGLFGGVAAGATVFAMSTFVLFFFFIPPYLTFEFGRAGDAVNLSLFMITGGMALYVIRTLNKAVDVAHLLADEAVIMQKRTATLFAELQHRVANNLAFLTAVLNKHGKQFGTEGPMAEALAAVKERLMAMSRSHRRLYDPAKIDMSIAQYLSELCAEQIAMSGKPVTHTVQCDDIFLELDQAVSVALIVSELVTNCLKHAFKDGAQGHIAVNFQRCSEQRELVLTVSDDGCGATTPSHGNGLGKTIINGLAAQLHASMKWENVVGTVVTLRFPMREQHASGERPNQGSRQAITLASPLPLLRQVIDAEAQPR
jgi:two-component sensor histidine kinase